MEPITSSTNITGNNKGYPATAASNPNDGVVNRAAAGANVAIDRAADNATDTVKPVIDRAAQIAHQAVNKAAAVAAPTADWVRHQGDSLLATQQKISSDAAHYVGAHPWRSLGFALAAGFVISRFMR